MAFYYSVWGSVTFPSVWSQAFINLFFSWNVILVDSWNPFVFRFDKRYRRIYDRFGQYVVNTEHVHQIMHSNVKWLYPTQQCSIYEDFSNPGKSRKVKHMKITADISLCRINIVPSAIHEQQKKTFIFTFQICGVCACVCVKLGWMRVCRLSSVLWVNIFLYFLLLIILLLGFSLYICFCFTYFPWLPNTFLYLVYADSYISSPPFRPLTKPPALI